ncbi:MAG: GyrI-like domain-containing protein [Armatimonadia bacterium]
MSQPNEPQVVEFGPYRAIGTRYVGKNENREITAMWDRDFLPRMAEVKPPLSGPHLAFGLCRCLPGVTDGSFEYIAAVIAADDAPVPEGMMEATVAGGTYVAFPAESLEVLTEAWQALPQWLAAHPEWEGYCGKDCCDCDTHPSFELYPEDFGEKGKLFVYMPIKPKA